MTDKALDTKNIFISCQHYLQLMKWEFKDGTEWEYIGVGNDYNGSKVEEIIRSYFNHPMVYLVIDRNNAYEIKVEGISERIGELLEGNEITLCKKDFSKMIVCSKIGVMKKGRRTPGNLT